VEREIPKVVILLATYNGVKFIDQQLTSLITQKDVQIEIHANDDGSTDGTLERLHHWKQEGWIKTLTQSEHIGATRAFLKLLGEYQSDGPVAFCDQDDVWASDKLISQINSLENDKPMLVFSSREFIDSLGNSIDASRKLTFSPSFLNALVENIVPGNSMLLNDKAVALIQKYKYPQVTHYDSWIYLLVSAHGECKYIPRELVKYRIHEKNSVGLRKNNLVALISSAKNFGQQAKYFRNVVNVDLPRESNLELNCIVSIFEGGNSFKKIMSVLKLQLRRQHFSDRLGFRIILLLGVLTKKF
jgi:glycosyltransferase involved in cell wall biosynthesis